MKITVLGSGAYGLALALAFNRNNNQVTVWTKIEKEKEEIITNRSYEKVLPGVMIPEDITITTDLSCVKNSDLIVLAIPIAFFRSTCMELKNYVDSNSIFCIATKGIENNTSSFPHEILEGIIKTSNISVLSGPTFAYDLANNSPSGLTVATTKDEIFNIIKKSLENDTLKLELSNDLVGTEICGSVKNIMAILAGMLDGLKACETTKALFYVKAIREIENLIINLNGNSNTAYLLCGIGDLILTCTSNKSRNFTLGKMLATTDSVTVSEYIENTTVEGYYTLVSIYQLIKNKNISSPLIELLYKILFEDLDKEKLFTSLISK